MTEAVASSSTMPNGSHDSATPGATAGSMSKLAAHKVVLPKELLKDLESDEGGRACLSADGDDDGFYYIPDFISEAEEAYLIEKIRSAPQPKWRALQARRLQYWGGQLSKQALIPEPMPDWLVQFPPLLERVSQTGAFRGSKHGQFNHCLVNEYEPGQGIMPHEDGDAYCPTVATISLGGHTLLDIYRYARQDRSGEGPIPSRDSGALDAARAREQDARFSLLQERRSLLVTKGAAYRLFLHGIAERIHETQEHLAAVTNGDMLIDKDLARQVQSAKTRLGSSTQENDESASDAPSLPRTSRLSLTLRDVERVAPKSLMAMLAKR